MERFGSPPQFTGVGASLTQFWRQILHCAHNLLTIRFPFMASEPGRCSFRVICKLLEGERLLATDCISPKLGPDQKAENCDPANYRNRTSHQSNFGFSRSWWWNKCR